ncbi:hypothetical protein BH23BAC1_BH23BAC1_12370 [soil metagenome]
MKDNVHNAVKRNILRILQFIEIPDNLLGLAADVTFETMSSGKEPVANKTFAMSVLYNISKKEPDLKRELKILIEDRMPYESAAFTSRGKKFLNELNKA